MVSVQIVKFWQVLRTPICKGNCLKYHSGATNCFKNLLNTDNRMTSDKHVNGIIFTDTIVERARLMRIELQWATAEAQSMTFLVFKYMHLKTK